jgi:hypothetical protein
MIPGSGSKAGSCACAADYSTYFHPFLMPWQCKQRCWMGLAATCQGPAGAHARRCLSSIEGKDVSMAFKFAGILTGAACGLVALAYAGAAQATDLRFTAGEYSKHTLPFFQQVAKDYEALDERFGGGGYPGGATTPV